MDVFVAAFNYLVVHAVGLISRVDSRPLHNPELCGKYDMRTPFEFREHKPVIKYGYHDIYNPERYYGKAYLP